MTVENTQSSVSYSGTSGGLTELPTTFAFLADEHLVVQRRTDSDSPFSTLTLGEDYSVDGAGDPEPGGTVTLTDSLGLGETATITRETELTQLNSFRSTGPLPVETIEVSFDKLTMIAQEQDRRIAALEALGNLVNVSDVANGLVIDSGFTTVNPVEDTFPMRVEVPNADRIAAIIPHFTKDSAPDESFDEPPQIDWRPHDANSIDILFVSGLEAETDYDYSLLVLYRP